ncbi:MAG TPA: efflux RND transporter periplasmic adaptor subunit [Gemmatimonadales bacterium]|jgi:membrane fusion protein (multidrug efflux system)|nr:efflux RND transporter periplasmic adaptor subunit [Gemmatimonadales bacterium]
MIRFRTAVFSAFLFAGCGKSNDSETAGQADPGKTRVPVGLGQVSRDSLVERLTLTGRLTPRPGGAALLTAPAAGVVQSLGVQIGDTVKRGEVVAQLEVPELAADAWQKEAAAAQADREAQRQQRLLSEGITSSRQAEEAAANARQAAAGAAAARDLLARTRVTSPISGVVQDVLVQRGERVDAGKPLVQVVAGDTLDLVASVPATQLGRLRVGLPVGVAEEGDTSYTAGRLAAVTPGVDSLTNAGAAVVRIPNSAGHLHPGAGATAKVRLGVHRDVLVVPDSAIVLAGDSSVVFVVSPDSIAHQRAVVRGVRDDGRTEVQGDLKAGDRVVTTGAFGLQNGMRVVPGGNANQARSQQP